MKLSLLTLLLTALSLPAVANDTVTWFHSDFPPISIVSGAEKGQGAADQWEQYLIEHLSEFHHETVIANVLRLQEEMKRRDNACNPALVKTPAREQFLLFSDPVTELLPNGFITLQSRRSDLAPFLNDKGELRLSELIATDRFTIGVAAGRSFGIAIDNALRTAKNPEKIAPFAAQDIFSSGLIQVANRHSLDGMIGYAIEMNYVLRRLKRDPASFWFIPLAEETALTTAYVACSKTPMGEKILARVNESLRAGGAEMATAAYRNWLPLEMRGYYDSLRKTSQRTRPSQK